MPSNEITSTHEIAEQDFDGFSEPDEVETAMVATKDAEGKGIEFHVSMRSYTMRDMEALIIEAAANQIVGRHNDLEMAKAIEAKCIEKITAKVDQALSKVTAEIIDQPITPKYPFQKNDAAPTTMREFIGLTGRDYLTSVVDSSGKPTTDRHYGKTRIQHLVEVYMHTAFETEIKRATNAAVREIQSAITAQHVAFLAAEKDRLRAALNKATAA